MPSHADSRVAGVVVISPRPLRSTHVVKAVESCLGPTSILVNRNVLDTQSICSHCRFLERKHRATRFSTPVIRSFVATSPELSSASIPLHLVSIISNDSATDP